MQAWREVKMEPNRLNDTGPIRRLAIAVPPATTTPTVLSSPLASIVAQFGGLTVIMFVLDSMILIL
jgi:hypothetical protein